MTGVIQGRDVLLQLYNGSTYTDFVCAKDLSIATNTSLILTTTVGDGYWDKYEGQANGYTISFSGVIRFDDTKFTAFDLFDFQSAMLPVQYRIFWTSMDGTDVRVMYGSAIIESSTLAGNNGSVATSDFSMRGSGKANITSDIDEIIPPTTFTAGWKWYTTNPSFGLRNTGASMDSMTGTGTFTKNGSIVADFRAAGLSKYLLMIEPIEEPVKTIYFNSATYIQGHIQDTVWFTPFTNKFGAKIYRYYLTRVPVSFNPLNLTTFS